jgi:hypothetical protein
MQQTHAFDRVVNGTDMGNIWNIKCSWKTWNEYLACSRFRWKNNIGGDLKKNGIRTGYSSGGPGLGRIYF